MLPKSGELYRHFKGGVYVVEGIGKHSETLEQMVSYRNTGGQLWFRPLSSWTEKVHIDGHEVPRFRPLREETLDDPNQMKFDDLIS